MKKFITFLLIFVSGLAVGQHNNELYNNGALISIQSGAEVHVLGDVHMYTATGILNNNGLIKTHGNSYSDTLFQQTGSGTYRIENALVNNGERQFIAGSFAVRTGPGPGEGTARIGVDDGSFYNLELANDQGMVYLVGIGNVADVRNSVNFKAGSQLNSIITHDIGTAGAIIYPVNGINYTGIFGMMNAADGLGSFINNSVTLNGNVSAVDSGYVIGKLRRAINPAGGSYGFVLGLEPAGANAARGIQYSAMDFVANSYDLITGYFQQGSPNAMPVQTECSGSSIDYFGGVHHGEWNFSDITNSGAELFTFWTWPQDDIFVTHPIWVITKNDALTGTPDQCGPSPVGLSRGGYSGLGEFGLAAATIYVMPMELTISPVAECIQDRVWLSWVMKSGQDRDLFSIERSVDGNNFVEIASVYGVKNANNELEYYYSESEGNNSAYYRVGWSGPNQATKYSDVISVHCSDHDFSEMHVYPNPSKGVFSVTLSGMENETVYLELVDITGKLISRRNVISNQRIDYDISNFAKGVYVLKARSNTRVSTERIIIE